MTGQGIPQLLTDGLCHGPRKFSFFPGTVYILAEINGGIWNYISFFLGTKIFFPKNLMTDQTFTKYGCKWKQANEY